MNLTPMPDLPISEHADEILALLREHQVLVIAGETGSGKTTQLPKLCLALGLGIGAMIGHTQPRRLAARTVAKRIAEEVGVTLGAGVGYAVRFSDQVTDETQVKVMTDGLLLNEIRHDRFLDSYDAIIIDEAHERSLNIDFLMGFLRRLVRKRKDLKLIITSATIDVERFSAFFDDAPVLAVGGRTYPVEVRYLDDRVLADDDADAMDEVLPDMIAALEEIQREPMGPARDVLAFFAGERDIFEAAHALRRHFGETLEVMPLYARLSFAEQRRVFETSGSKRRVVLATNVAETSLTVPNIGYVIDPGFARINRYSYRSKLERLPIEAISKASADQRKGRCGRIAPGVCYRLYSEADYQSRPDFTDPEIRRVNLASVVLQMEAFRLGDVATFPFIDPPDPRAVRDAIRLLEELQALEGGKLTNAGRQMARIPVDPRLARMLVEAQRQGAVRELMIIVAGLAVQDPRERPLQKAQAADTAHQPFADEKSDFLSFLKMWDWLEAQREALTRSRYDRALKKAFISVPRAREWREIHRQLRLIGRELKLQENASPAGYRTIHECVLSGSLSLIANHDERGQYIGARQLKLRIFPGSGLAGKTPRWIVAGEIMETSRVYARCVAFVEPAWIERQGAHLIKAQYSGPSWSLKRGEVIASKRVNLYGLRLADARQVSYSDIDAVISRDLFIREGLIPGAVESPPPFLMANVKTMAMVEELEAKGRRRDLIVSDDEIHAFYDARLPSGVCRMADLTAWLKKASPQARDELVLTEEALLRQAAAGLTEASFPTTLQLGDVALKVSYKFAPGERDDGATVHVPVGVLPAISPEALEWGIPGLLPNLVERWLRTLPKQKRRRLAPLPDKIDELCAALTKPDAFRQGRFLTALASLVQDRYGLRVDEADWDRERVDDHLKLYVRVVDGNGKALTSGRDLRFIKQKLSSNSETPSQQAERAEIRGLEGFPDRPIDGQQLLGRAGNQVVKYPGLKDSGDRVDWCLFDEIRTRDLARKAGLARLALNHLGQVSTYFRKALDRHPKLGLHFAGLGGAADLKQALLLNVVWYCFFEDRPLPDTPDAFMTRLDECRGELATTFNRVTADFAEILSLRFSIVTQVDALTSPAYEQTKADVLAQLASLAPRDVLATTPRRYLALVPRYLAGIERRLQQLEGHVPKDQRLIADIQPLLARLERVGEAELAEESRLLALRILSEEVRVSLFAADIARQSVSDHPLDGAYFERPWKASLKRLNAEISAEERRVGLA